MHRTLSSKFVILAPIVIAEIFLLLVLMYMVFGIEIGVLILPFFFVLFLGLLCAGMMWAREKVRKEAETNERLRVFSKSLEGIDEVARAIEDVSGQDKNSGP